MRSFPRVAVLLILIGALCLPGATALPQSNSPTAQPAATALDLIRVTNQVRTGNGLQALTVNNILMATAQWTAEYMAANHLHGHVGDVRGRVMAAGYGGGEAAWATENIMNGYLTAEEIVMGVWSDDLHSIPVKNPIYCDIGAGMAQADDGEIYYVLHAAYSNSRACGPYISPDGTRLPAVPTARPGTTTTVQPTQPPTDFSQLVFAVVPATPQPDGSVIHTVRQGQSLWSIATAYGTTIKEILLFNGMPTDRQTIIIGQKLNIPVKYTPVPSLTPSPQVIESPASSPHPTSTPGIKSSPLLPQLTPTAGQVEASSDPLEGVVRTGIFAAFGAGLLLVIVGLIFRKRSA